MPVSRLAHVAVLTTPTRRPVRARFLWRPQLLTR
jgi:hypothetical protein